MFISNKNDFLAGPVYIVSVPTQVVTLTQVVTSDNLGLPQVITMVPADPSGNFLPQMKYYILHINLHHATVLE